MPGLTNDNGDQMSDDDRSDTSEREVEELTDDEFPTYFVERDGRLFYNSDTCPYPLPVDGDESARFKLMHKTLKRLLGAHCPGPVLEVLAPIPEFPGSRRRKVLDMCNGTGNWVMAMARAFPHVEFRGVDIVPIATRYPSPNVRFEIHDVGEQFRWVNGDFDLIHARDISMAIRDWPNLIHECARLLRPGGLFVSCEWLHSPVVDPGKGLDVNTYAPASVRFFSTIHQILQGKGVHLGSPNSHLYSVPLNPHLTLTHSPSFTDISTEQRLAPIGQWPELDQRRKRIGRDQKIILQQFSRSVMPMLTGAGMTKAAAEQLRADYLEEVDNKDSLVCKYVIIHARKL